MCLKTMATVNHLFSVALAMVIVIEVAGYCPEPGTAIYEVGTHCYKDIAPRDDQTVDQAISYYFFWQNYCLRTTDMEDCFSGDGFEDCMPEETQYYAERGHGLARESLERAGLYPDYNSVCEGKSPSRLVIELYNRVGREQFASCAAGEEVQRCLQPWYRESPQYSDNFSIGSHGRHFSDLELVLLKRWAIATYQCLVVAVDANCPQGTQEMFDFLMNQTIPDAVKGTIHWLTPIPINQTALMSLSRRSTVGVFGDPHIKIYKSTVLETCAAEGTRDFLISDYVKMVGVNEHITLSALTTKATFLRQFNLTFYNLSGSALGTYKASEESHQFDISDTFNNGEKMISFGDEFLSLTKTANQVRISASHIATTVVIRARRFNDHIFYTMTLRTSDAILDRSRGLLITGCGILERLSADTDLPRRRKRSAHEQMCASACSQVENISNLLFNETCYFDCATTGNTTIGLLSNDFRDGLLSIAKEDASFSLVDDTPATSTPKTSPGPSRASGSTFSLWLISSMLAYLAISRKSIPP